LKLTSERCVHLLRYISCSTACTLLPSQSNTRRCSRKLISKRSSNSLNEM
jgi:hypothetical protein